MEPNTFTPRCSQCGWRLRDADAAHGSLECVVHLAAQVAATRSVTDTRLHRGLDARDLRAALAMVREVAS